MLHETLRDKSYRLIFGTDTVAGQRFDLALIVLITLSSISVILSSVSLFGQQYQVWFSRLDWTFTAIFTIEYCFRVYSSPWPRRYVFSFYGLVDLLSFLPSYLAFIFSGDSYWLIVRMLRLLRIFRLPSLFMYLSEVNVLVRSFYASRRKFFVMFLVMLMLNILLGSLMFVAEQSNNGIKSIPDGIRLTLALMTFSESYEFVSSTFFSQILVFFSRFLGYCYIAVFTGIFTVQIAREMQFQTQSIKCDNCGRMDHHRDAKYCFHCGTLIEP